VVHGQHGVRLTATECSLQLDDWLTTFAHESLSDLHEEQPHSFSDKGAIVERRSILIFFRRLTRMHRRNVGREF